MKTGGCASGNRPKINHFPKRSLIYKFKLKKNLSLTKYPVSNQQFAALLSQTCIPIPRTLTHLQFTVIGFSNICGIRTPVQIKSVVAEASVAWRMSLNPIISIYIVFTTGPLLSFWWTEVGSLNSYNAFFTCCFLEVAIRFILTRIVSLWDVFEIVCFLFWEKFLFCP